MRFLVNNAWLIVFLIVPCGLFAGWSPKEIPPCVFCDDDSDCFKYPSGPIIEQVPVLIYLSCNGAKPSDLDSISFVHDKLGWVIATCGKTRNHRSSQLNEKDIIHIAEKLLVNPKVDPTRIILFGFSGQGAQALGVALKYPRLFAGAISDCAHLGAVTRFDPKASNKQLFYIITREFDWNRDYNEIFHTACIENGIGDTLLVEPGKHEIGPTEEIFSACRWFERRWRSE
ncbi:hypothetical protein KAH81_07830 [bacterium]|nr:hypothetical protein [bacterium]